MASSESATVTSATPARSCLSRPHLPDPTLMVLSRDEAGGDDSLVERFEYFAGGLELGNAFN